jgi:putative addiction module killer protein
MGYSSFESERAIVIEVRTTQIFRDWLRNLRDGVTQARISKRIDRLALGNPGQSRSVGEGIVELKVDHGPGYRVYYVNKGSVIVVILCGGDKSTQQKDILKAKEIAAEIEMEEL